MNDCFIKYHNNQQSYFVFQLIKLRRYKEKVKIKNIVKNFTNAFDFTIKILMLVYKYNYKQ